MNPTPNSQLQIVMAYKIKRDNRGIHIGLGGTTDKIGFHGTTPSVQRASADQDVATDDASALVLVNELRAALVEKGLIKGSA